MGHIAGMEPLRLEVLGPVRAWLGGTELALGPPMQRALLVRLGTQPGQPVSRGELIDALWGDDPPASAANGVHRYAAALRGILEPGLGRRAPGRVLIAAPGGYLLRLDPGQVDAALFARVLRAAREARAAGHMDQAAAAFDRALALWPGTPLPGIPGPFAETQRVRLTEEYLTAAEDRAELLLAAGDQRQTAGHLAHLVTEHPFRERLAGLHMLALFREGRQAEALAAYQRTRGLLIDELGVEPGLELQQLHQRILTGDPLLAPGNGASPRAGHPTPRQLPARPMTFVGRAAQLRELTELLEEAASNDRTVVISAINGSAGVGKTALAMQWAHRVSDRFPDGQLYADLRGFDPNGPPLHPRDVLYGFLEALGYSPDQMPAALDSRAGLYRSLLADRRVLVVLDNARDADQVRPLLPGGPGCIAVITSRNTLAELVVREGAHPLAVDLLSGQESTALLARRLGAARVAADPQAAAELVELCGRLPLALAIAAARAASHPGFPLAALAAELRQASARLDALNAGEPYADLRAVLTSSVTALASQASEVFGLLGLVPGPDISLTAASSLIARPPVRTRALIGQLEDAHLVQQYIPGRYRMHDLVRLYAAEFGHNIHSARNRDVALERLTDFYLHTAAAASLKYEPTCNLKLSEPVPGCHPEDLPSEPAALEWFDTEHLCLLAAQQIAARQGWHARVWQLAWAMAYFDRRQGRLQDQVAAWQAGLAAAENSSDTIAQVRAHHFLAEACALTGEHGHALDHLHRALPLALDTRDAEGYAHVCHMLALVWSMKGNDRQALEHATAARDLFHALGDAGHEARALGDVGWLHARLGSYSQAQAHCEVACALHRQHGDRTAEAATLDSLGYIAHSTGDHQQAVGYYQQALSLYRDPTFRHAYREASTLDRLGHAHAALAQYHHASHAWHDALRICRAQHRTADAERIHQQLTDLGNRPVSPS